jgi:tetratricopeptide (TPR) repeat protein
MRCRRGMLSAAVVLLVAANTATPCALPTDRALALRQSLAELEQRHGPVAPELLPILASLAELRFEQAELAEATELRRRSLKIAIAGYGSASVPAAEAMAALARLYIERRRYLDAEPLTIAAKGNLRDRLGDFAPALAPVLADQARIALARGKDNRARDWVDQAIAIDQKNGGAAQSDRLRVLGAVLAHQQGFDDSERVLRQTLALDRANGNSLATARSLAALAHAYLRQKRYTEALPLIEEATLIDQTGLGATHPLIAEDFRDLGLIYLATNRAADAEIALRTGVDLLARGAGRDTPTMAYLMLDLARAERLLGHEDKAHSLFTAARSILNAAEDEERDRQRHA